MSFKLFFIISYFLNVEKLYFFSLLCDSVLEPCTDSAQSAPPNFSFDSVLADNSIRSGADEGDLLAQAMNSTINAFVPTTANQNQAESFFRNPSSPGLLSSALHLPNDRLASVKEETVQFSSDDLIGTTFKL